MVKYSFSVVSLVIISILFLMGASADGCNEPTKNSDEVQAQQQEVILQEATAQTGMPAIKNFRERKLLKDILEMRDQDGLSTFTYTFSEMTGDYKFFCNSIGYGLPYATQYTNPSRIEHGYHGNMQDIPQADPNGLFSPASAEGTWVLCKDPNGNEVRPLYIEPRVIVSPFELEKRGLIAPVTEKM